MSGDFERQHWTLDKRIPLALIVTLAIQSAGFAFYMGKLSSRVEHNEEQLNRKFGEGDRLTRLEVKMDNLTETIGRVERALEVK